jgi:hypothetical protein
MVIPNTYLYRQQDGAFPNVFKDLYRHHAYGWCECEERCCFLHASSFSFGSVLYIQVGAGVGDGFVPALVCFFRPPNGRD